MGKIAYCHCGSALEQNAGFCGSCGAKVGGEAPPPQALARAQPESSQGRVSRKVFIVVLLLLTLSGLALGFFAGFRFHAWWAGKTQPLVAGGTGIPAPPPGVEGIEMPLDPPPPGYETTSGIARADDFEFAIDRCWHTGSSITCRLMVTNLLDDREIRLSKRNTVLTDREGNEFVAEDIALGKERANYSGLRREMIKNVPVKMVIEFGKRSAKVGSIKLLGVSFQSPRQQVLLKFRDVPLERPGR